VHHKERLHAAHCTLEHGKASKLLTVITISIQHNMVSVETILKAWQLRDAIAHADTDCKQRVQFAE
jgi:hypothetical protein